MSWGPQAAESPGTGDKRVWGSHNRAGRRCWLQACDSEHLPLRATESHGRRGPSKGDVDPATSSFSFTVGQFFPFCFPMFGERSLKNPASDFQEGLAKC